MEYRPIGALRVSAVGLGCNSFGLTLAAEPSGAIVDTALAEGINFFDTADAYGDTKSEEFLGSCLARRRDDVVLATKFGMPLDDASRGGGRPEYVRRALDASLRRLRTDRVDLYQLHVPDPDVPIEETLGALNDLVQEGKVRELGCSNFTAEQLRAAAEAPVPADGKRFVSVQNEYSLVRREAEQSVLPECERSDLAFIPYYPLGGGLLTGKYRRGVPPPAGSRLAPPRRGAPAGGSPRALVESLRTGNLPRIPRRRDLLNERNLDLVESLIEFAERRGHSLLELAFAWLLGRPQVVSVIAGATRPEQVRANAAASTWRLSPAERAEIDGILGEPA